MRHASSSPRRGVSDHYAQSGLARAVKGALEEAGLLRGGSSSAAAFVTTCTVEDLAPLDEFHVGGRAATLHFLRQALKVRAGDRVLDVGCGVGGAARCAHGEGAAAVVGVDLTESYVETGAMLNALCGISEDAVALRVGSALDLAAAVTRDGVDDDGVDDDGRRHGSAGFDKAYLLHVGMNISDKTTLMESIARQLKPGGTLGVYDIMQCNSADSAGSADIAAAGETFEYPLPWASTEAQNACAPPETYRDAFAAAGLELTLEENRRDFALESFKQIQEMRTKAAEGNIPPSPIGLQLLMGAQFETKMKNIVQGIVADRFAPVIMIARKPEADDCEKPTAPSISTRSGSL